MIDLNDFICFHSNEIEIGIDLSDSDKIFSSLENTELKKEYLLASTPKHIVKYNQFYIKKNLVTVNEFRTFIRESNYITDSENEGWGWIWDGKWIKKKNVSWERPFLDISDDFYIENADVFPVMQVSWKDAEAYIKWLSLKTGKIFRLPYEFEWEVLAQYADYNSIFFTDKTNILNFNTDKNYILKINEKLAESKFQIGLVWEWMIDWYSGYDKSIQNKDFGFIYKILRGGSLLSENYQRTKEFRFRRCPSARSPYYSFRIVYTSSNAEKSP